MNHHEPQALAPIAQARLELHPSHRRAALEAAARCTAGWPSAEALAAGTGPLRLTPDGIWARSSRRDSEEAAASRMDSSTGEVVRRRKRRGAPFAYALIHRDGQDPELVESSFRLDGAITRDGRVGAAALAVLQAMQEIGRSYGRMDSRTRAAAQTAVGAGRQFLQASGIHPAGGL